MNYNLDRLDELFGDINDITPEKMESLVKESIKAFEKVITQLNSSDEKEREEAKKAAEKLRDTLEKHSRKAMESINMSAKELEAFTSNPNNFSPEEWEAMQQARQDLMAYQKDMAQKGLMPGQMEEKEQGAKKRRKPLWIPS